MMKFSLLILYLFINSFGIYAKEHNTLILDSNLAFWGISSEGIFPVTDRECKKEGFIDKNGRTIIPVIYDKIKIFGNGLAFLRKENIWYLTDIKYNMKPLNSGEPAFPYSDGIAVLSFPCEKKYTYVDSNLNHIVKLDSYFAFKHFYNGIAATPSYKSQESSAEWIYINKYGQQIIDTKYSWAGDFSVEKFPVAWVTIENPFKKREYPGIQSLIDVKGHILFSIDSPYILEKYSDNRSLFISALDSEYYGFLDKKGRIVIPPKYRVASSFSEGLAAVQSLKSKKWGYINTDGEWIIPPQFDWAYPFSEGVAVVRSNANYANLLIDKFGNIIMRLK